MKIDAPGAPTCINGYAPLIIRIDNITKFYHTVRYKFLLLRVSLSAAKPKVCDTAWWRKVFLFVSVIFFISVLRFLKSTIGDGNG